MHVNIYLNFIDKTEEAFNFYKQVFGGEFDDVNYFRDIPGGDKMPPSEQKKIMHISIKLGKNLVLMGSDIPAEKASGFKMGDNVVISLNTESQEETDTIFSKLSAGGTITMPLEKTFWNAYFGMLTDKFGVHWMFNFDLNQK